jgi:hypothetical protein
MNNKAEDIKIREWLQIKDYQSDYDEQGHKMYYSLDMPKILTEYAHHLSSTKEKEWMSNDEASALLMEFLLFGKRYPKFLSDGFKNIIDEFIKQRKSNPQHP